MTIHTALFHPDHCAVKMPESRQPVKSHQILALMPALPLRDKMFYGVCLSVASVRPTGGAKDLSPVSYSHLHMSLQLFGMSP